MQYNSINEEDPSAQTLLYYDFYDPFIIAQKAKQVCYVPYPKICVDKHGWCAVIKTKPRGCVEVVGIYENAPKMKQITKIEEMIGLHDETHNDVTLIKTIQVDTSVDKDYMEES